MNGQVPPRRSVSAMCPDGRPRADKHSLNSDLIASINPVVPVLDRLLGFRVHDHAFQL